MTEERILPYQYQVDSDQNAAVQDASLEASSMLAGLLDLMPHNWHGGIGGA